MFHTLIGCCIWGLLIVLRKVKNNNTITVSFSDCAIGGILILLFARGVYDEAEQEFYLKVLLSGISYFCFRNIVYKHWIWYIGIFFLMCCIQFFDSIYKQPEYFLFEEKLSRIYGSFMNPSVWGEFLSIQFILLVGFCYRFQHKRVLFGGLLLLGLCFLWLIISSSSRTGLLSLIVVGVYTVFVFYKRRRSITLLLTTGILILVCALCVIGGSNNKINSTNGRFSIWKITCSMIKKQPIWGYGVDGFHKKYMIYQSEFFRENVDKSNRELADNNRFVFNEYLKIIVEYGIIGLLVVAILVWILSNGIDWNCFRSQMCLCCLLAYSVFFLFSYPLFLWQLVFLFLFFLAGIDSRSYKKRQLNIPRKPFYYLIIILYTSFISIFISHYRNIRKWEKILSSPEDINIKVNRLLILRPALDDTPDFLLDLGKRLKNIGRIEEAVPILAKSYSLFSDYESALALGELHYYKKQVQEAEQYLKMASNMIPHRVTPHFLLFCLYRDHGIIHEAKNECKKIKELPIKIYTPQVNAMLQEINIYHITANTKDSIK